MSNTDSDLANRPVDRIERFHSLQAGQYWRALQAIHEQAISEGMVLLIQSIKWVDNAPHTIVVRSHPTANHVGQHSYLTADFLTRFEYEPDHVRIRHEELMAVQNKINVLQKELLEAQSNPEVMNGIIHERIQHANGVQNKALSLNHQPVDLGSGSVAHAMTIGVNQAQIDALKHRADQEFLIANTKLSWVKEKTNEITQNIAALTPFYEEQSAALIAQTEDMRETIRKLTDGIGSLDLYTGKDVVVETLASGESAHFNEPLTVFQKKLMMNEELSVWLDVDDKFDFSSDALFVETLQAHTSFIDQLLPTPRCIIAMATTRNAVDYKSDWDNYTLNERNKAVFLLVRDGGNIYRVYSPVSSHLGASRLFPSKNDQDALFRGIRGEEISFADIAYTKRLDRHELHALHYKRFLILMAGLDYRLKLFGSFYDEPLSFVSMAFQTRYMRFVHDDDGTGLLSGEQRMPVTEWITDKNDYLRSGSRVLCYWPALMTPNTAPAAFALKGEYQNSYPDHDISTAIAYREGNTLCVDVKVTKQSTSRSFNCKVTLCDNNRKAINGSFSSKRKKALHSGYFNTHEEDGLGWLCLDAVTPGDLLWYIHNRDERKTHLLYIRFFKKAQQYLQNELDWEIPIRNDLRQALIDGQIVDQGETDKLIQSAIIAWRSEYKGKPLPILGAPDYRHGLTELLNVMFKLVNTEGRSQMVEVFLSETGYQPLRLIVTGKAEWVVYAAPKPDERDDRIQAHAWVHRIILKPGKSSGLQEKSRKWATLPSLSASETTIHEWAEVEQWRNIDPVFPSFAVKQKLFEFANSFKSTLHAYIGQTPEAAWCETTEEWMDCSLEGSSKAKYVSFPVLNIPFGLAYNPKHKEIYFLCITSKYPHALLHNNAPEKHKNVIKKYVIDCFHSKKSGEDYFAKSLKIDDLFSLTMKPLTFTKSDYSLLESGYELRGWSASPSLDVALLNKKFSLGDQTLIWLADTVLDAEGYTRLDEYAGLQLHPKEQRICVFELSGEKRMRRLDIYPHDNREISLNNYEKLDKRTVFKSMADARDYVLNRSSQSMYCTLERNTTDTLPSGCLERWNSRLKYG